jgi:hypothetical protein
LPAYSTDLDRIDQAFAKLKMALRKSAACANARLKLIQDRQDNASEESVSDFGLAGYSAGVKWKML